MEKVNKMKKLNPNNQVVKKTVTVVSLTVKVIKKLKKKILNHQNLKIKNSQKLTIKNLMNSQSQK